MRKMLLLGFGAVIVLFVIAVGVSGLQKHDARSGAQKVSDAFVSDILANKYDASYNMFSDSAKQSTSAIDWQNEVNHLSVFFYGKKPTFQSIDTSKSFQSASYSITGLDGNYTFSAVMVQNDKSWQVQSFDSQRKS